MNYVNLTPHSVTLVEGDTTTTLTSSGLARVASIPGQPIGGILYSAPAFGEVEGLPDPQPGTLYIVSALVAGRCVGRADVFSPGTGPNDGAIRDEKGLIKAVTRLIQAPLF